MPIKTDLRGLAAGLGAFREQEVIVTLTATVEVPLTVLLAEGESATDLTREETQVAKSLASRGDPEWKVTGVREVGA